MPRVPVDPPPAFKIVKEYLDAIDERMATALNDNSVEMPLKACWPIYKLHHQRSRYIFTMYKDGRIDAGLYRYLCRHKFVDTDLVGFWKRRGFENLCCLRCIDSLSKNGNVCICRVPGRYTDQPHEVECEFCGCRGCSGF